MYVYVLTGQSCFPQYGRDVDVSQQQAEAAVVSTYTVYIYGLDGQADLFCSRLTTSTSSSTL